LIDSVLDKAGS